MKTDKRRTAEYPRQGLKVFKVTFLEWNPATGQEDLNVESKNVLAENAQGAVQEATSMLSEGDQKHYQVQEIEIVTYLD